ncbi:MAG: DUF1801 domain-containing protein [Bacteroidota bacterium]
MDNRIQQLILALPETKLKLVLELRDIILKQHPSIEELVKFGRISYQDKHKNDIAFICIKAKHAHIELGFFKGSHLDNTLGLLRGKNNLIRRVVIHELDDSITIQINSWFRAFV